MKKERFITLVLVALIVMASVTFRLFLTQLVPQPFWWDQEEYESYAWKMFNAPWFLAAHSYRSYPYPLLLAVFYRFAGFGNHQAVFFMQAVLDSFTGLLIYLALRKATPNRLLPYLGFMLYAVNPFTSGYVGMVLSEVLTAFFIMAAVTSGLYFMSSPGVLTGLLLGFFAGMAAETRNAAFAWAAIPIVLTLIWVKWRKHKQAFVAVIAGLLLTVLHPLIANWKTYGELSVTKVDSFYAMEFYNGGVLKILPPFTRFYPPGHMEMWNEYWSEYHPGRTAAERKAIAAKYWAKGWEIVKRDPWDYLRWRLYKTWYVWQKENIFFIVEPGFETHKALTYTGNLMILLLALFGVTAGFSVSRRAGWRYLLGAAAGTFLYGTLAFSISHAEYRLTIPFYPVVMLSAAAGTVTLVILIRRAVSRIL